MTNTGLVEVKCVSCGTPHIVIVPAARYRLWATGQARIQDALPDLTDDERELLKTNICPVCWDKLFS